MSSIKGSCLCGKITYEIDADPLFTANCNCASCQKESGSAFTAIIGVPEVAFALEGDCIAKYTREGDSGKPIHRHFCSNCGTPIYGKGEITPGILYLRAGTVDSGIDYEPQANVYWRDHKDWLPEGIPCFDTLPPE